MKAYFLALLQNLDKLTGIRQYEKLCQSNNHKAEINLLLDILGRVCDQFPYIPEQAKMKIIDACIVSDNEFIGLNARIVYKWLNANKDVYFKEQAHQETEVYEPLTGEAREARLKEWLEAVNNLASVQTERSNHVNDFVKQIQPKDGKKYQPLTGEQVYQKERHLEYVRANFDTRGEKKDTWIPEDEFNKLFDEGLI